jgi:hypothetical protein
MPRPRARSLFEIAGQWIAVIPNRAGYYRFWNDTDSGRTRRASLGTEDFERAKSILAEIVVKGAAKSTDSHLSLVLEDYFLKRTDHLASKDAARSAGKHFLSCWGALVKAGAIDDDKQKAFIDYSLKLNHSLGYIARNLGVLAAALANAKINVEVTYGEGAIVAKWPDVRPKPKRQAFNPTDADIARIWASPMPDALRRWILIEMLTGCRPEAAIDLSSAARDRDAGIIDLNPPGRIQNKKFRAKVRTQPLLARALDSWEKEDAKSSVKRLGGRYVGYASVDSADTALERVCRRPEVDLPRMGVYSFRHKAATVMRLDGVPPEQRSLQLGHRRQDLRVTDSYGEWDPKYLREAAAALERWTKRIIKMAKGIEKRRKFSHGIRTTTPARRKMAA